jgi:uncharacterized caspase-like protein
MKPVFSGGRAVIVGIANYPTAPLPDTVRKDALDVAARLTDPSISGYDPSSVRLLTNNDATADRLRKALIEEAEKCSSDGTLLFYFSGHGAVFQEGSDKRSVLVGHDWTGSDTKGLIFDDELLAIFAQTAASQRVLILDACHAGGFSRLKGASLPEGKELLAGADFSRLSGGKGMVVLCSSRADEYSLAPPGMNNSLFTAALLDALGGGAKDRGDGAIGVFDLFNFVAEVVPKRASQHPVFKGDLEGNFAIALRPSSKSIGLLPRAERLSADEQVEALLIGLYPLGPTQDQVWSRAGGDLSRVTLAGHGAAQWHAALRLVRQGGGLSLETLLDVASSDFPANATIRNLQNI